MQIKDLLVLGKAKFLGEVQMAGMLITFRIADISYTALRGMAWHEWVHSSYNTAGATLASDGRIMMPSGPYISTDYGLGYQLDTDVIAAGKSYLTSA